MHCFWLICLLSLFWIVYFSFQFCCFFLCVFLDSVIRYTHFYNCYIFFIDLEILSLVTISVLRSVLSDIIIAISALSFCLIFLFQYFYFQPICVFESYRQCIVGSFKKVHFAKLCLLIRVFNSLTCNHQEGGIYACDFAVSYTAYIFLFLCSSITAFFCGKYRYFLEKNLNFLMGSGFLKLPGLLHLPGLAEGLCVCVGAHVHCWTSSSQLPGIAFLSVQTLLSAWIEPQC